MPEVESVGIFDVTIESATITRKPTVQIKIGKETRTRSIICRRTSDEAASATKNGTMRQNVARRRAEIQEVNGYAIDILRKNGIDAPVNQRVVEIANDIESGVLEARPENAAALIESLRSTVRGAD